MVELLFVACLATAPTDCREHALVFTGVTPYQCLMGAQPELAKWSNTNPGQMIQSWSCRAVSFAERET